MHVAIGAGHRRASGGAEEGRIEHLDIAEKSARVAGDATAGIDFARMLGGLAPLPGSGATARRWEMLATAAAADLTAARVAEAHLDALAILAEADVDPGTDLAPIGAGPGSTWGVFAAEGPGVRVDASGGGPGGWRLSGTKPWCSLAGRLSHALITAHTGDGRRRLFAIALGDGTVVAAKGGWASRGLSDVTSGSIALDSTPAVPIGEDDWYLRRSGFAWGGAGVAACWFGGAVGVARSMYASMYASKDPGSAARPADQIAQMHLGAVDLALTGARTVLAEAARQIDGGLADGPAGEVLAAEVRGVVAGAAESVLTRSGHALGPAPLALDQDHARRVADLQIYLRQHHAERDDAALGRALLAGGRPW